MTEYMSRVERARIANRNKVGREVGEEAVLIGVEDHSELDGCIVRVLGKERGLFLVRLPDSEILRVRAGNLRILSTPKIEPVVDRRETEWKEEPLLPSWAVKKAEREVSTRVQAGGERSEERPRRPEEVRWRREEKLLAARMAGEVSENRPRRREEEWERGRAFVERKRERSTTATTRRREEVPKKEITKAGSEVKLEFGKPSLGVQGRVVERRGVLSGIVSRPNLNGVQVTVLNEGERGRVRVRVEEGEDGGKHLLLLPSKVVPLPPPYVRHASKKKKPGFLARIFFCL